MQDDERSCLLQSVSKRCVDVRWRSLSTRQSHHLRIQCTSPVQDLLLYRMG